jgi:hypothetical protein
MNLTDGTPAMSAAEMRELLRTGRATPLLEHHFPVPARVEGQWWYSPADNPGIGFVPAEDSRAAMFDQMAARRSAARAAVAAADARSRP